MNKLFFHLVLVLSLLISGCASNASGPKTPQVLQPTAVSSALFQVVKPDGTNVGVTIADLKALSLKQVTVEGKVEEGPGLLDVIHFAGVTEFTEITLTGSSNPATLSREQVDDNTILDLTNHGTVKLATIYIPKASWTKDIIEITVK